MRALWELSTHPQRVRLSQEFIALSVHRAAIRKITARVIDHTNSVNAVFISRFFDARGVDSEAFPPTMMGYIINGLAQVIINEELLGISGHRREVEAFVETWLAKLGEERPTDVATKKLPAPP